MRLLSVWALCLSLLLALPGVAQSATKATKHTDETEAGNPLIPHYLLQDHRGRAVTNSDFRGRMQLITFGFTSCPDVCPTTLLAIKNILEGLGKRAYQLQAIFISVDPERDTSSMLREYTSAFDSRILGLRGSPELLQSAAKSFNVRYEKVSEPGAAADVYTMNHSAGMYLLGSDGRFLVKFASNAEPKEVATRILKLMAADRSLTPKDR